jgi:hypothetical protein
MSPQTQSCGLGGDSGFSKKGPKMTKKEYRRRPRAAGWVQTLDFQKKAENDQKRMSPQTQSCGLGGDSGFSKKGRK